MTRIICLSLFALLVNDATAQHGGRAGGFGRGGTGPGSGRSGFAPGGPRQGQLRSSAVARGVGFNRGTSVFPYGFGGFGYPDGSLPYDAGNEYGYPPEPAIITVQQPPHEVHGVIHDYTPAAPSTATSSFKGEPPTFGIVLKDGSTRSALAVVVEDDALMGHVLKYTDPEGRNLQVPLGKVDREATRNLNRERNLSFWLPATP